MSITFSTCWYVFKAKFDTMTYLKWIDNMLSNVNNYNLVIYSDSFSSPCLQPYLDNPRVKLVIKPHEMFYNYRYKNAWIANHEKNELLKNRVDWKVNMLWAEKIHFVYETIECQYFDTEFYGWCDIGYFRGNEKDLDYGALSKWPSEQKIARLNKEKIYYACVNNDDVYMDSLYQMVQNRNRFTLPAVPIPPHQVSIAGGFFICHKDKIDWWRDTFDQRLSLYFRQNYLVKDDQVVIIDCILSNLDDFNLIRENDHRYDNWFLFQRYLL